MISCRIPTYDRITHTTECQKNKILKVNIGADRCSFAFLNFVLHDNQSNLQNGLQLVNSSCSKKVSLSSRIISDSAPNKHNLPFNCTGTSNSIIAMSLWKAGLLK